MALRKLSEIDNADPNCEACKGEGWVCEDHAEKAWGYGDGCCGAAGAPCRCNPLYDDQLNNYTDEAIA